MPPQQGASGRQPVGHAGSDTKQHEMGERRKDGRLGLERRTVEQETAGDKSHLLTCHLFACSGRQRRRGAVSESSCKCSFSRRSVLRAAGSPHTNKHGLTRTDTAAPHAHPGNANSAETVGPAGPAEFLRPIRNPVNPVNPVHSPLLRVLRPAFSGGRSACASSLFRVFLCALLLLLLALPLLGEIQTMADLNLNNGRYPFKYFDPGLVPADLQADELFVKEPPTP